MTFHIKPLFVIAAALGLAACEAHLPAGSSLDEGGFGNATMRNTQAMTQCVGKPKGHIVPEHVVVLNPEYDLDPKSPRDTVVTQYRRAQVRCSGDLNGKYAMVVFEEYVKSGAEFPARETGGLSEIADAGG